MENALETSRGRVLKLQCHSSPTCAPLTAASRSAGGRGARIDPARSVSQDIAPVNKRGCYAGPEQMFSHPLPAPSRLSRHSLPAIPPLPKVTSSPAWLPLLAELPNQLKKKKIKNINCWFGRSK